MLKWINQPYYLYTTKADYVFVFKFGERSTMHRKIRDQSALKLTITIILYSPEIWKLLKVSGVQEQGKGLRSKCRKANLWVPLWPTCSTEEKVSQPSWGLEQTTNQANDNRHARRGKIHFLKTQRTISRVWTELVTILYHKETIK